MTASVIADLGSLGMPVRLRRPVMLNSGRVVAEGTRPTILEPALAGHFAGLTGVNIDGFRVPMRIFEFQSRDGDDILVRDAESRQPLIVRRGEEVVVNFDLAATQAFEFTDSKRPIYTYIPGFNIQNVPSRVRRPLSNIVEAFHSGRDADLVSKYRVLPLTSREFVVLLLNAVLTAGKHAEARPFQWPSGKKAVFLSLHDVDTPGFLQRQQRDTLFQVEQKHSIRSTWFVPTGFLGRHDDAVDFLLASGHEVGWHGHKHDHRDHVGHFAVRAVDALRRSRLSTAANFPTGMRAPKLLVSQHLFEELERSCPMLRYDTSLRNGIVPYPLWLHGRRSKILEIPTTVPTDIHLYNETAGVPSRERLKIMLDSQIARTEKLLAVGGIISIVTHPEETLSERPDFLNMYDQYLSYIRKQPDVWFATAGELFQYWTGETKAPDKTSLEWIRQPAGACAS